MSYANRYHMRTARWKLIHAANAVVSGPPLRMRHWQRAAFICRQRQLVRPEIIRMATGRL